MDLQQATLVARSLNRYHPDMLILTVLLLLLVANGAPILARLLPGLRHWSRPLDGGYRLADEQRLFGKHKTWRGLLAAVLLTTVTAGLLSFPLWLGALVGALSMVGDLLASFVKRRLQLPPGATAPGLDQVPESLLPLVVLYRPLELEWIEIVLITGLFVILNLLLSRVLYYLHIRRHPW